MTDTENKTINMVPSVKYLFLISENLTNISEDLMKYSIFILPREETIIEINKYIKNVKKSIEIECSIFEYSIIYCYNKNFTKEYTSPIYIDKLNSILLNLDKNSYLHNNTLLDEIINNNIDCSSIAFLQPHQIHPEQWTDIIKKNERNEISKNNNN
jgi:hypothetical protein